VKTAARARAVCVLLAAAGVACAPKQTIPIDCVPDDVEIYVDGRMLSEVPDEIELRSDRAHTFFFKGPGYKPELVLLRSDWSDGEPRLEPAELCVRPVYIGVDRNLRLEVEEDERKPEP
jgi:hypothetical protein